MITEHLIANAQIYYIKMPEKNEKILLDKSARELFSEHAANNDCFVFGKIMRQREYDPRDNTRYVHYRCIAIPNSYRSILDERKP